MFHKIDNALCRQYYQLLPLYRVVMSTSVESQTMDAGFFRISLPHLGMEALVAMANKLLMHYGCKTTTGRFMRQSYFLLYIKGLSFQPLQESFQQYGYLTMHSWMKTIWEILSMFGLHTVIADVCHTYPQKGNQFIMQVLIKAGHKSGSLRRPTESASTSKCCSCQTY
jgi:hypothetical protein